MLESKALVEDSDSIIEGFSDEKLLQRREVGDIMGMEQRNLVFNIIVFVVDWNGGEMSG